MEALKIFYILYYKWRKIDHIKKDVSYKRHSDFFNYYLAKKSEDVRKETIETLTFIEEEFIPYLNKFGTI